MTQSQSDDFDRLERLYHAWLAARAAAIDPNRGATDTESDRRTEALETAERLLLVEPSPLMRTIWLKLEVLDSYLAQDLIDGRSLLALAAIKADLKWMANLRETA